MRLRLQVREFLIFLGVERGSFRPMLPSEENPNQHLCDSPMSHLSAVGLPTSTMCVRGHPHGRRSQAPYAGRRRTRCHDDYRRHTSDATDWGDWGTRGTPAHAPGGTHKVPDPFTMTHGLNTIVSSHVHHFHTIKRCPLYRITNI